MKFIFSLLILTTGIAALSSCKKDHPPAPVEPPGPLQVTSFAPVRAAKDSVITILGKNFSTTPAGNIVTINNVPATVLSAKGDILTVKVPLHAGIGVVQVQVGSQVAGAPTIFQYLYTVTTLAGDGNFGFKEGPGNAAEFNSPNGAGVDGAGNIYVADVLNHRIRKVTSDGQVSTWAGDGTKVFKEGKGTAASFYNPYGVAVTSAGVVYVADANNYRVRKITAAGDVSTLAGDGTPGFKEGAGNVAQFKNLEGVAVDAAENVYVADTYNSSIRKITPAGEVSTLAGNGTYGFQEGTGSAARFSFPRGLAVDGAGYVFVADGDNNRIRRITPAGEVVTLAGDGTAGFQDGSGPIAKFNHPSGVAADGHGNIYVADLINQRIRQISPTGVVFTIAGDGVQGFKEGVGTNAEFNYPSGIALDGAGNIYVVDAGNHRIRKLE
ncbi:IPT/TIG domain-containing protein [Puia sp.]|jgi:sugar lactone lactonase YvrE|uniref:IPT/TIG domain-containing protein n=1 Tax=Puia sp. TaxID=2045100 RepID=UPI002F4002EC